MDRIGWAVVGMGVWLGACASAPPPHDRMASSEASIRAANEAGADRIPQGALELKLAQEEVEKAKALMRDGDNGPAAFMLLRAQADAELALALAHEEKTRLEAQQALDKLRAIGGGPSETRGSAPAGASPPPSTVPPAPTPRTVP